MNELKLTKGGLAYKAVAAVISLVMVTSFIPVTAIQAYAKDANSSSVAEQNLNEKEATTEIVATEGAENAKATEQQPAQTVEVASNDDTAVEATLATEASAVVVAENANDAALAANDAVLASDEIKGGDTITTSGTYYLAAGATGTITVAEGIQVVVVGKGSAEKFEGLNFEIGDGTTFTAKDIYAAQSKSQEKGTFDFVGNGTFKIEGFNNVDNDGGLNAAVVHVGKDCTVHFDGTGTLYGYKSALCAYIGGNANEANGNIIFDGGYWFIKGTKTGAVIGGDSTTDKGGDIIINGGELYVKGVARGALIGGSSQGKSGDVYIYGGLVELYEDFTGPAIGAGNSANAGGLTIEGGSLKTTRSSNSWNSKGGAATFNGLPAIDWTAVQTTNASEYAVLTLDASDYLKNLSSDTVKVSVDGKDFYEGRGYTYVTNEVKNPTKADTAGAETDTQANWLTNDISWKIGLDDYPVDSTTGTRSAYPNKSGSSFVVDKNLYLALSKENHEVTINGDTYNYTWNAEKGVFETPTLNYSTHAQNIGWQDEVSNGSVAGTTGEALRLEAIRINLDEETLAGLEGGVKYRTHVQNEGWQNYVEDDEESGTTGSSYRLEAIQIELTGQVAEKYDVYYRVHAQNIGWMGWAMNGEKAGTEGYAYRLEAIQIMLVEKGNAVPDSFKGVTSAVDYAFVSDSEGPSDPYSGELVSYNTHVQNVGWQEYSKMGEAAGTTGQALRLEGIQINLGGAAAALKGSIEYRTHVQNIGWMDYVSDGAMSGTSGLALRLEAINIRLTDEIEDAYDVYYRVHAQNIGWMGWAKNGLAAGTAGFAYRLEGIQIVLVQKGGEAPADNYGGIISDVSYAFKEA